MMDYFCGMFDQWKPLTLISSQDHFQRSSPSLISDTPQVGFEPVQNLSSDFAEWIFMPQLRRPKAILEIKKATFFCVQ